MEDIYLDNNSTTKVLPEVVEAMQRCYQETFANPASQHRAGQKACSALDRLRDEMGRLLGLRLDGMPPDRLILTSGGTEANNLALRGLCGPPGSNIIVSAIEHPSVLEPARFLQTQGYDVRSLPASPVGVVDLAKLHALLDDRTTLVSVMLGNHETGVLQPIRALAELCHRAGVLVHTDAVQTVGKIPVDFQALDVDALSLAAHKLHGPAGIGALLLRGSVSIQPILFGGFQQGGTRPGTESLALACGLHAALQVWSNNASQLEMQMRQRRDQLEQSLKSQIPPVVVNGADAERLPNTTNISLPGADRQALLLALDMAGVACSTGSACASGSSEPSPVLLAMGLDRAVVDGAIRISLSAVTTDAEMEEAARRIVAVLRRAMTPQSRRNRPATSRQ